MTGRRLRAPRQNHAKLLEPAPLEVPHAVQYNQNLLQNSTVRIGQLAMPAFRQQARREALLAAQHYLQSRGEPIPAAPKTGPLLITGHQPELAHPGVWLKNFQLRQLADQLQGQALNLIVDNDTIKSTAIRVPAYHPTRPELVRLRKVLFDQSGGEAPYEDRPVRDPAMWASLADRVEAITQNWGFTPLLRSIWPSEEPSASLSIGERFSQLRREQERRWSCCNLELPVSWLARTSSFREFARQLATDHRFHLVYNQAVRDYRRMYSLRSSRHPVPDLAGDDTAWEAPYWVWQGKGPRQRLIVRAGVWNADLELRPRALTLTLFARLALGDYFLHGIGGGKYDEVTDLIIQNYFGMPAPRLMVVTGTLQLPLASFPGTENDCRESLAIQRDLLWNPQRFLSEKNLSDPAVQALLRERAQLLSSSPDTARERRIRHGRIRTILESLRSMIRTRLQAQIQRHEQIQAAQWANEVLQRRDYAWVLFPERELKEFLHQQPREASIDEQTINR